MRHPEKFGTGVPEGIIASEASNSANVAGSLVTIMAFGIPGDAVTAVMLGAMIIHGIQPGPVFMVQEPRVVYALLLFGVFGYALVKFGFPVAPLILGVILGDQIEVNLVRALMTDADPWLFFVRPISGAMLALSVASVLLALWQHRRQYRGAPAEAEPDF